MNRNDGNRSPNTHGADEAKRAAASDAEPSAGNREFQMNVHEEREEHNDPGGASSRQDQRAPEEFASTRPVPLVHCASGPIMTFGQPGPVSVITVFSNWGPYPVSLSCPYCKTFVTTQVCPQPGLLTWLMCSGMAMVGCFLGCCFLPFCVYECQDVEHFCPNCRRILGVFRRV